MSLIGKRIVLGISAGIAAYKSADLTRRLLEAGAQVRVAMTPAATEFVTPLTFQALSGNPVHHALLDPLSEAAMGHIELARWADVILVAPASADFLARLAHGMGNDLLSTLCLATQAPIVLAPAMNRVMWSNLATQHNVALLKKRSMTLLGPAEGSQACGETGAGRMLEPMQLVEALSARFNHGVLHKMRVLITAGPTREALDPIRYISNRSSGKMGFSLAQAATEAGAKVTLISGPVRLATPPGVSRIDVESAQQMYTAVMHEVSNAHIFIACAAVADYCPLQTVQQKIKKSSETLTLDLVRTADIVSSVAKLDTRPFVLGFAAETHDLEKYARVKLENKALDMIAANQVGLPDSGFDSEYNALEVLWPNGQQSFPRAHKTQLARKLIKLLAEQYATTHADITESQ